MLKVEALGKTFGGLTALRDVSFNVDDGEIRAIIGPNGAGKTTLFNLVAGTFRPTSGTVALDGHVISGLSAAAVGASGIARTFQQPQVFRTLTVMENVMLGGHRYHKGGFLACGLGLPFTRREEAKLRGVAAEWLRFVGLEDEADRPASELPLGKQRYVEIARAMATRAKLILMDEPAAGLDDTETRQLGDLVRSIRARGTTVLLIDHHMDFVMNLADRVLVLNFGEWLAEGAPDEIRRSKKVIDAYLGSADDA